MLVRLYARKDGMMDFEGFVSAVTSVMIVEKLNGPNVTRMLGHPLFTEVCLVVHPLFTDVSTPSSNADYDTQLILLEPE